MGQGHREELLKVFQASWLAWVGLFLLLGVAAWLIQQVRTRFRDREDPAEEGHQMLMQMGELHQRGGLSNEEYRSIKSKLNATPDHSTRSNP